MVHQNLIAPDVLDEIQQRLDLIVAEEDVRLLFAVESGSRAWGFPSPDSDYDVRFVYARHITDYLRLEDRRDVIERPIVDEIDLNGWDIKKALQLMLKSNAVISEWLQSPIVYRAEPSVVDDLIAIKVSTPELGKGARRPALDALIIDEMKAAEAAVPHMPVTEAGLSEDANRLFQRIVQNKSD